jgi:NADH-quinone oxidoreductase subunit I
MPSIIREVAETFSTLAQGFSVTFKNMFRKTVTENYPHEPVHFQPRYRGIHVLHRDENGLEKCVGCFLCAAACPANCIYIEAAENTDANRISAGERYAEVYNIDYSRCIFCGYCVEACPTDANSRPTTSTRWSIAKNSCLKKRRRQRLPQADSI